MSTARITLRLDESLRDRLAIVARTSHKAESEVVREAIEEYLERCEPVKTAYDAFKAAGAIGMIKDGPKDMSTNPKYMEGFGRD